MSYLDVQELAGPPRSFSLAQLLIAPPHKLFPVRRARQVDYGGVLFFTALTLVWSMAGEFPRASDKMRDFVGVKTPGPPKHLEIVSPTIHLLPRLSLCY